MIDAAVWKERRSSALAHCHAVSAKLEAQERPNERARMMLEYAYEALTQEHSATSTNERAMLIMRARAYAASALLIARIWEAA